MIEIFTDVVLNVTGFQLLLLAALLLLRAPRPSLERNLLAAFLLSKAFLIGRWFVLRYQLVAAAEHPVLYLTSCAGFFLLAPLLYLYVRALCAPDFRLTPRHLLHLVPTLVAILLAACAGALDEGALRLGPAPVESFLVHNFWRLFWTANLLQILLYIGAMFRAVAAHRRRFRRLHASADPRDLSWLRGLLLVISLHWLFVATRSSAALFDLWPSSLVAVVDVLAIAIFLVFTTVLVLKGMAQLPLGLVAAEPAEGGPSLSPAELATVAERVRGCMRFERPHLDPQLSLEGLARRLELPQWQLSRVLNQGLQQNFFNFVNGYRVEEAKRQLRDPACNAKTMLQILHEAGFNSKSTFNEAFKRHAGMTPSQYRRVRQHELRTARELAARS